MTEPRKELQRYTIEVDGQKVGEGIEPDWNQLEYDHAERLMESRIVEIRQALKEKRLIMAGFDRGTPSTTYTFVVVRP